MDSLSVSPSSGSNVYLTTSIAQQKVAADRADVLATETQLEQDKTQLDQDLTYLSTLQRKSHDVQQLEGKHAQTNALQKIANGAQAAKQATQQALSYLINSTSDKPTIGTNINVLV